MSASNTILIILIIIVFLGSLYFYLNTDISKLYVKEGLTTMNGDQRCPNILIQKGPKYYLYNSNVAQVPGVNPIEFNNLEEYVEFTEWQRGQGIRCPVLYMQHSFDAQGKPVYKIRPSPMDLQGGLPPVADPGAVAANANANFIDDAAKPPMNANSYPAFDPMEPNAGSPKDNIKKLKGLSANPMDPNWGGDAYTQSLIDAGKYSGDEVSIFVP